MGNTPYYYDADHRLPRYENSYYFYFGLKVGKTALDKFNSQFFATCESVDGETSPVKLGIVANSWCSENGTDLDGYLIIDVTGIPTPYDIQIGGVTYSNLGYTAEGVTDEKLFFAKDATAEELATRMGDNTLKDFVKAPNDQSGNTSTMLNNGVYTLTITDSDGNISETEIDIKGKSLQYSVDVTKFKQPNDVMREEAESAGKTTPDAYYPWIAEHEMAANNERPYGGVIEIYDIYDGQTYDQLENYVIRISWYNDSVYGFNEIIVTNGTIGGLPNNVKATSIDGMFHFFVGIPEGGVTYTIKVIERCYKVETGWYTSGNIVTKRVLVEEPTPFKMYINEIDYDFISDWKTGFTYNKNTGSISESSRNGNVVGWLDIDNTLSSGKYYGLDGFGYNVGGDKWKVLTDYKSLYSSYEKAKEYYFAIEYDSDYTAEEKSEALKAVKEAAQACVDFKEEYKALIRRAFYITCPSRNQSLSISVRTDDYPVATKIGYKQEQTSTEDETLNILSSTSYVYEDTDSISEIGIPSITTKDSDSFGNETFKVSAYEDLRYATDNTSSGRLTDAKWLKGMYLVATTNATGKTKPSGLSTSESSEGGMVISTNQLDKFFQVPFIDKIFDLEMMGWMYFDRIPYFKPTESYKLGKRVSMNGLLAGKLMNGGIDGKKTGYIVCNNGIKQGELTIFDTQTLNGIQISVRTVDGNSEDSIPTKRYLCGYGIEKYINGEVAEFLETFNIANNFREYYVYPEDKLADGSKPCRQYTSVFKVQSKLNIEDSNGCQIEEDIYGDMHVELDSSSYDNCNGDRFLKVNLAGSTDGASYMFYVFKIGDVFKDYPLNSVNFNDDHGTFCHIEQVPTIFSPSSDPASLFTYEIGRTNLSNNVYGRMQSSVVEDDGTSSTSYGYGNNGEFTFVPILGSGNGKGSYFVVAVTDNNCRTISPVYDFGDVHAGIKVGKVIIKTEVETAPDEEEEESTYSAGEDGEEGGGESGGEGGDDGGSTEPQTETTETYRLAVFLTDDTLNPTSGMYYFANLQYFLEMSCKLNAVTTIEGVDSVDAGKSTPVMVEVSDDEYKELSKLMKNALVKPILAAKTEVYATDDVGLRHKCCIDTSEMSDTVWYGVSWSPNGGKWKHGELYNGTEAVITEVYEKGELINVFDVIKETTGEYVPPVLDEESPFLGFGTGKTKATSGKFYNIDEISSGEITINDTDGSHIFYAIYDNTVRVVWKIKDTDEQIGKEYEVEPGTSIASEDDYPMWWGGTPTLDEVKNGREGFKFAGWEGYTPGDPIESSITIYAVYKAVHNVHWMDGYNEIASAEIKKDETLYAGDTSAAPATTDGEYSDAATKTAHGDWKYKDADGDVTTDAEEIPGFAIIDENGELTVTDEMPKDIYMIAVPAEYVFEYGSEE